MSGKAINGFVVFCACALLAGCGGGNTTALHRYISEAERLMDESPSEATARMDSIAEADYYTLNRAWKARYVLVKCSLALRAGPQGDFPLDHQIREAKRWYESNSERQKEVQTGLFLAIYLDRHKKRDEAHDMFMETLQKAKNYGLDNEAGYVNSYLADLYYAGSRLLMAKDSYAEAAVFFRKAGNALSLAYAKRDIGRTYCLMDSLEQALTYIIDADAMADTLHIPLLKSSVLNELGNIYLEWKEYEKAIGYFRKAMNTDTTSRISDQIALIDLYIETNRLEEAKLLLDSINQPSLPDEYKKNVYYDYYRIKEKEGNYEVALSYLKETLSELQERVEETANLNYAESERNFDKLHALMRVNVLTIRSQRLLITVAFLLMAASAVLAIFLAWRNRMRKYISEMQEKTVSLSGQLKRLKEKPDEHASEIMELKQKLILIRNKLLANSSVKKDLLRKMASKNYLSGKLLDEDIRMKIENEIELIYPNFDQKLKEKFPGLTTEEIMSCYLSFFEFDTNQEAILLGISPESVSKRRTRTKKELGIVRTHSNLTLFLKEFYDK